LPSTTGEPGGLGVPIVARAELTALLSEADAARAKAIEECAKLCDDESRKAWREGMTEPKDQFSWKPSLSRRYAETAEAIRALAAQDRAKETG
jgi:hypothetical protein